jgi:hypothetical protein
MGALFSPWTNTASKVSLAAIVLFVGGLITFLLVWVRSPLFRSQRDPVEQPIDFDHRHHYGDDGIDCRYCHDSVEKAANAGYPPTSLCMNCHAQVWNRSPLLAPVRASYFSDRPIVWRRVQRLPDWVYFNHSIHVNKGVGCATCHGRVDRMAAVMLLAPLTMQWCLDCHRDPGPNLRPPEFITSMDWAPTDVDRAALAESLLHRYQVHTRTSCTTCHR